MNKSKINVLYFASSKGIGLTTHLTQYAIGLKNQGINIIVAYDGKAQEGGLIAELAKHNLKSIVIPELESWKLASFLKNIVRLSKIIDKENIDIIHCQGITNLILSYFSKKICNAKPKIVTYVHAHAHRKRISKLFLLLSNPLMNKFSDLVFPVSKQTESLLLKYGLKADKSIVMYNALNTEKIKKHVIEDPEEDFNAIIKEVKDKRFIIYASKLTPGKGHSTLLFAAKKVIERFPNVLFVFTGDGELKDELLKMSRNLDVENNIIFTGRIKYKSLIKLMSLSYIGVVPSYAETFCHALIEPMALGKPVISTPVGIAEEVIKDGETGYLVPIRDSDKLAERIIYLLENSQLVEKMGENAEKKVDGKFSIEKISRNIVEVYRLMVRGKQA